MTSRKQSTGSGQSLDPDDELLAHRDPYVPYMSHILLPQLALEVLQERFPAAAIAPIEPRLRYLRYKPNISLLASVTASGGEPVFMLQAVSDAHRPKVAKLVLKQGIGDAGWGAVAHPGLWLVAATPRADRALPGVARVLAGRRHIGRTIEPDSVVPLRYKPHRRWLATGRWRDLPCVLRVTTPGAARRFAPTYHHLDRLGVIRSLAVNVEWGVTVTQWVEGTVLAKHPRTAAETTGHLGALVARFHEAEPGPLRAPPDHGQALFDTSEMIAALCPHLRAAAARFADAAVKQLPSGAMRASHGDLTHDQVVIDPAGRPRLIDFDRACVDHPAYDLGSWAAQAILELHEATRIPTDPMAILEPLLAGYSVVRRPPDPGDIRFCTAVAIFKKAVEPFRRHAPGWACQVQRRVDLAADVLP